jgi:acylphosphatase
MIAKHITFIGRVQGVGFRFTAQRAANRRQLTGFVRNLWDGTVEMLAQGRPEDIDDCIQETKIEEIPPDPKYSDFQITF